MTDEREECRRRLRELAFDGPIPLGGDWLSASAAVCLACGAMVLLDDATTGSDGTRIERGIDLHWRWHNEEDS